MPDCDDPECPATKAIEAFTEFAHVPPSIQADKQKVDAIANALYTVHNTVGHHLQANFAEGILAVLDFLETLAADCKRAQALVDKANKAKFN
jgi:hypothetical protein